MSVLNIISASPYLFHYLRKIPEFNYRSTKRKIATWEKKITYPLLDLGCGTGEYASLFKSDGYFGVDISLRYIEFARRNNPSYSFSPCDACALPFEDGYFKSIMINGVLHHLENSVASSIIQETHRVLAVNGQCIIIEDIPSPRSNFLGKVMHSFDRGEHIRRPEEYRDLIANRFSILSDEKYRSGICDYFLFSLKK